MKKVLFIDNDTMTNLHHKIIMESFVDSHYDMEVVFEHNSLQALESISSQRPDQLPVLIFIDVYIPNFTARSFLNAYAKIPYSSPNVIILNSARFIEDSTPWLRHHLVLDVMPKPLTLPYLTSWIGIP